MNKHVKAVIFVIEQTGLSVIALSQKGKHLKFTVCNEDGITRKLVCGKTPSDHRAMLNFRSTCRNIAAHC